MANYTIVSEIINTTDDTGAAVSIPQLKLTFTNDVKSFYYGKSTGQTDADAIIDFKAKLTAHGLVLIE